MAVDISNLVVALGSVASDGSFSGGEGFTSTIVVTGQYRLTLETNNAFNDGEGAILVTPHSPSGANAQITTAHVSNTVKDIFIYRTGGSVTNSAFDVVFFRYPKTT